MDRPPATVWRACAGYTETNWTPLPSCTHWESSFDEVPIPYDVHEHFSVQDEPRRRPSASLALPFQRQVTSSEVQQASYSGKRPHLLERDTGINDEVYEYAESCLVSEEAIQGFRQMTKRVQSLGAKTTPFAV